MEWSYIFSSEQVFCLISVLLDAILTSLISFFCKKKWT